MMFKKSVQKQKKIEEIKEPEQLKKIAEKFDKQKKELKKEPVNDVQIRN